MPYNVTVSFGPNEEYEYRFPDAEPRALGRDGASHWLHAEYEALECAPRSPVGKLLLLDIILDVAKYGGADRFAAGSDWGRRFALCCAAALDRDVRVDVTNLVIA